MTKAMRCEPLPYLVTHHEELALCRIVRSARLAAETEPPVVAYRRICPSDLDERSTRHQAARTVVGMTNSAKQHILWVTRDDAGTVADVVLREQAGVEDSAVEVRTESLGKWDVAMLPAGSRDEWGSTFPEVMNVWWNQLPPEGRVYVIGPT